MYYIRLNMRFLLSKTVYVFLVLLILPGLLSATNKVSIYVSAHQDDWQLFMGVNAYNDIANSSDSLRVVFIYVTAGDYSDCVNASDTNPIPYFLAREQGAKNSVELAANSHKERFTWKNDTATINEHLLIRSSYRFVTCYFLRLADGAMGGSRNISLKNFHRNHFRNNYSIDSLTCYKNLSDLMQTCHAIVLNEDQTAEKVYLNLLDTSEIYNPNDHSDHYESAMLFLESGTKANWQVTLYEGYNSGRTNRIANLSETDIMKESGLFAAYNQAMIDDGYPSIWNNDYIRFLDKNYFRIVLGEQVTETNSANIALAILALFVSVISLFTYYLLKKK